MSECFLVVEDDLLLAFRPVASRKAANKWLLDNIDDPERADAIFCELLDNATTSAERINLEQLFEEPRVISGPWLWADGKYRKGYEIADVTGQYSFGVTVVVERAVLEAIAADHPKDMDDTIEFRGDEAFLLSDGFESGEHRLGPISAHDADAVGLGVDLYEAPGWSWNIVEADDCAEVTRP